MWLGGWRRTYLGGPALALAPPQRPRRLRRRPPGRLDVAAPTRLRPALRGGYPGGFTWRGLEQGHGGRCFAVALPGTGEAWASKCSEGMANG